MNMLHAGCSFCGAITPLWCSGQFMPHAPIPAAYISNGFRCQLCGPLPPVFTCSRCWTMQMLYLPGSTSMPTQPLPGAAQYMAPVVQANQGSDQHELSGKLSDVAKNAAGSFAQGFGKEVASSLFKAWLGR